MGPHASGCTGGTKIRAFLIFGILACNLHWKIHLLSRIPMVYSMKISDKQVVGKLKIGVLKRTRKPELENQKDQIQNSQVKFGAVKLDVFRK